METIRLPPDVLDAVRVSNAFLEGCGYHLPHLTLVSTEVLKDGFRVVYETSRTDTEKAVIITERKIVLLDKTGRIESFSTERKK